MRGTVGIEAALFGVPVVTAGTGRYAGRGFDSRFIHPPGISPQTGDFGNLSPTFAGTGRACRAVCLTGTLFRRPFRLSSSSPFRTSLDHKATPKVVARCRTREEWMAAQDMRQLAEWLADGKSEDMRVLPSQTDNSPDGRGARGAKLNAGRIFYKAHNGYGHGDLQLAPAWGRGSKGVPRKASKLLAGEPLIAYTIREARKSRYITRLIVSTENEEIARVARAHCAEVPFVRPAELALDDVLNLPVFQHALSWLAEHPNNTLRRSSCTCGQRRLHGPRSTLIKRSNYPDISGTGFGASPSRSASEQPLKMWRVQRNAVHPLYSSRGVRSRRAL